MQENKKLSFRYDIQALRGLAVTLVLLYHANPNWVAGGFLGVDIFFTISGYVIFRMIDTAVKEGRFSLLDFYKRRVIRLFPALFVTIATTLLAAVYFLPNHRLSGTLESSLWSVVFAPNIYFYLDSGYFAAESIHKPLLHLWSLGVEEQFYIVFPLLALVVSRWSDATARVTFIVLGLGSVVLSSYWVFANPEAAFFLTPARAFQFLVGALVWVLPTIHIRERLVHLIWVVLIFLIVVICVFFATQATPLPGWRAGLLSCLVAALIYIGASRQFVPFWIKNKLVQSVGNSSYSLYLAHWPVTVLLSYYLAGKDANLIAIVSLACGVLAGIILYRLVEKPMRTYSFKWVVLSPVGISLAVVLGVAYLVKPATVDQLAGENFQVNEELQSDVEESITETTKLILVGDSHANMYKKYALKWLGSDNVLTLSYSGCPPLSGVVKIYNARGREGRSDICRDKQISWGRHLSKVKNNVVLLSARWEYYVRDSVEGYPYVRQDWLLIENVQSAEVDGDREKTRSNLLLGLTKMIDMLQNNKVVLVGDVPLHFLASIDCTEREVAAGNITTMEINQKCGTLNSILPEKAHHRLVQELSDIASKYENVMYVNPMDVLCMDGICPLVIDGKLVYQNRDHLSEFGAELVLNAVFNRL